MLSKYKQQTLSLGLNSVHCSVLGFLVAGMETISKVSMSSDVFDQQGSNFQFVEFPQKM